jgi:hypothetical protein
VGKALRPHASLSCATIMLCDLRPSAARALTSRPGFAFTGGSLLASTRRAKLMCSITLFNLSWHQLQIVNSRDKIKAQRKPFASIPITIGQNLESLEVAYHILIENAIARQRSIVLFIFLRKGMLFAPFFGHVCLEMHLLQPLVSAISQYADRRVNVRF